MVILGHKCREEYNMSDKNLFDVLGRRVANARKLRNMTQAELGKASGKILNTISEIERGEGNPKIATLHAIAHALRVPLAELLVYEPHTIVTDEIKKVYINTIHEIRKLTPEQMKMVCDMVKTINKSSNNEPTDIYNDLIPPADNG